MIRNQNEMKMTLMVMKKRSTAPLTIGLVCLMAVAAVAVPVQAQGEAQRGFGEVVDVRVVNVEVVVEDRDGVRVPDLSPSDFRLEVDGREVPIEYFTEVRGGEAVAAQTAAAAGGVASVPALEAGTAVGTSYLVFIDDYFALKRDRDSVLERLRSDLPRLGPADRMALVAYDGRRLEMLSSWSQSVPALERALRAAEERPAMGLQRMAERRTADRDQSIARQGSSTSFDRTIGTRMDLSVRDYAMRLGDQVERSVAAASATLRSFAAPPGRRVMMLLSGGWPYQPVQYTLDRFAALALPEREIAEGPDLFSPLVATANLLGYTIYPVDVPGLQGDTVDASLASADEAASFQQLSGDREQDVQASLTFIARSTGGKALINSRREQLFDTVTADTRSYYWLGFTPERKGDDRRRRIEVSVTRPGLRVRTRENFQDFSRQKEVSMSVESALLFGSPPSSRPLAVTLGKPEKSGLRSLRVPLRIEVPADLVTMLPIDGAYVAELEVRIAALDEEGRTSDIPVVPIRLRAAGPARAGQTIPYDIQIELRRSRQTVVVSVYDVASSEMFATTLEIDP